MSAAPTAVSDMMVTVKSREVQRGLLAEMRGDRATASRHFLAAAHLEMVLADDYATVGHDELAFRSTVSAASCLWRAGKHKQARELFGSLTSQNMGRAGEIQGIIADLEKHAVAS